MYKNEQIWIINEQINQKNNKLWPKRADVLLTRLDLTVLMIQNLMKKIMLQNPMTNSILNT